MSERRLLMIPGPVEFEPTVMRALAEKTRGHLDPVFVARFGRALAKLRQVFRAASDAQPFVVAGGGTLAMELSVASLIEPGDRAVVIETGYFGARMATILERFGAEVTRVGADAGAVPDEASVASALERVRPKLVTITHVDTSTAVRAPVERFAAMARAAGALVVVDGVCSLGGELFHQEAWGVDVAFTGSQKAIGAPPGLALVVASARALEAFRARKRPVGSLYLDWSEWEPVFRAYETASGAYFATPAVNLINALEQALTEVLAEGLDARAARHAKLAGAVRAGAAALGLDFVAAKPEWRADTLTALYYPSGVDGSMLARTALEGVTIAGGLHPAIKAKSFRVGHMNAVTASDVLVTLGAIERALHASGHRFEPGAGLAAAQRALIE